MKGSEIALLKMLLFAKQSLTFFGGRGVGKYPYFKNSSKDAGIFEFYFVNYD